MAAAATVAMAVADNNRDGRGRQQSKKCGSGGHSGRDSARGNRNCGSVAATAAVALADNR